MEKMIDLSDLLKHEILDLYSAEEQIIEALPAMIDKARNKELKKALSDHLSVTEKQKNRLDKVKELIGGKENGEENEEEKKGFFSRLFGGEGKQKCIGTEGLIKEGEKMMREDMSPETMDAAIIAGAQKIEHYEISGYGTARAYARELQMEEVAKLLEQTLNEEYEADDRLTQLAVGKVNLEAEQAKDAGNGMEMNAAAENKERRRVPVKKSAPATSPSKGRDNKKDEKKQASNKPASKADNKRNNKKPAPVKKAAPKKSSKKTSPARKNTPKKKSTAK